MSAPGRRGGAVAVVASTDIARAQRVVDTLPRTGTTVSRPFACDIRRAAGVRQLIDEVAGSLGPVDILVNSAGLFYPTPAGETSETEVDRIVDLNIKGTFHCINAVVPQMRARGGGKIVNLSSFVGAVVGMAGNSLYAATKAAITFMTKSLARELAGHNINVNGVAPGCVRTPMNEALRTASEFKSVLDVLIASVPSQVKFSSPRELARLVAFLASDEARLMHGSMVVADEGISAGI